MYVAFVFCFCFFVFWFFLVFLMQERLEEKQFFLFFVVLLVEDVIRKVSFSFNTTIIIEGCTALRAHDVSDGTESRRGEGGGGRGCDGNVAGAALHPGARVRHGLANPRYLHRT